MTSDELRVTAPNVGGLLLWFVAFAVAGLSNSFGSFQAALIAQPTKAAQSTVGRTSAPKMPADLRKYLKSELGSRDSPLSDSDFVEARFRMDLYDLDRDGRKEYFIVGYCSPTGNCDLWVIERTSQGFRSLLESSLVHVVCIRATKTKGYQDVETRSHGSAFDSTVIVFRFGGDVYGPRDSYELRWEYDDKTGKTRQVEGPEKMPQCHRLFSQPTEPVK